MGEGSFVRGAFTAAVFIAFTAACGTPTNPTDGGRDGMSGDALSIDDVVVDGDSATLDIGSDAVPDVPIGQDIALDAGCTSAAQCDDGIDCTDDSCSTGTCLHTAVPARCPAGQSCDVRMGCRAGRACASNMDCVDMDPCTTNERCDMAARVCLVDPLDGDRDGHPPRVCGGGDCDDSNASVHPGATEVCNARDDNCDGMIDNGVAHPEACTHCRCYFECMTSPSTCASRLDDCVGSIEASVGTCSNAAAVRTALAGCSPDRCATSCVPAALGTCACTTGRWCAAAGRCVDTRTDASNCGACDRRCTAEMMCSGGVCVCPGTQTACAGRCVDTTSDLSNCGACGRTCGTGASCVAGTCTCPSAQTLCSGACIDTTSDSTNCGGCGRVCPGGTGSFCAYAVCSGGTCGLRGCPDPGGGTVCGAVRTCIFSDPANCGRCGNACPMGVNCCRGTCS